MREVVSKKLKVEQTLIDKVVGYFDPVAGARRLQARATMAVVGGYTGAMKSKRSLKQWITGGGSANADLLPDLPTLRERSRDLVRNDPLACGALNTVCTKVVGTGLSLQSRIDYEALGMTEEEASEWKRNTEREFRLWAETTSCDLTRAQNFYGLQDLVFRSAMESGDVLITFPMVPRRFEIYDLRLQIIEGDRVCNKSGARETNDLAGGVQMDQYGAPIAYHVLKRHPGDMQGGSRDWDTVAAYGSRSGRRNALLLFRKVRPGQVRGAPYLSPVIETFKQLSRYTEAEIMAAVVSGMFTVFVTSEGEGLNIPEVDGKTTSNNPSSTSAELGNGAIVDMAPGEKVEFANPGRPNTAFDPFVQAILRQIGVALELPFEVLIKHFTASYSAARSALLEAWHFFKIRRAWLASDFCQPVYENWMDEAVSRGRVQAPGYFDHPELRAAYLKSEWQGDGPGSIDPEKEARAARERMDIGLTTLEAESVAYDGGDWETKHAQQCKEKRMRVAGGLTEKPAAPASQTIPAPPNSDAEDK